MIIRMTCFTAEMERWSALAEALCGIRIVDGDVWRVYALAGGRLALHAVHPGDTLRGTCSIAGDVANLQEFMDVVHPREGQLELVESEHGPSIVATSPALPDFLIDLREGEVVHSGKTQVAPLFFSPDVMAGARFLVSLGLSVRLSSEAHTYVDFVDDGVVAIHIGDPTCGYGFEHPDVVELVDPLTEAGFRVTLIDESYGRTLRVENPDDPAIEAEIWINQTQTDLYGYREGM